MKPPEHAVRDLGQASKRLSDWSARMTQQEIADASGLDIRYIWNSETKGGRSDLAK
jgi:hypothetical protein